MLTPSQIITLSNLIDHHCAARCAVSNYSAKSDGPVEKFVKDVQTTGEALDKWLDSVVIPDGPQKTIAWFRDSLRAYGTTAIECGTKHNPAVDSIEHQLLAAIAQLLSKAET